MLSFSYSLPLCVSMETELLLELKILRFVFLCVWFETWANFIKIEKEIYGFPFYWQLGKPLCSEEKDLDKHNQKKEKLKSIVLQGKKVK